MVRLWLSLAILLGVARAQSQVSSPLLVAKTTTDSTSTDAVNPEPVSPNSVSPREEGRSLLLPDVPPLPAGKATLLGGTIQSVDHIRDRLVLQFFGGGRATVLFDERTRVLRDGKSASLDELKSGQRAYVDTTLDRTYIFARSIRIAAQAPTGQSSGQIVNFSPGSGELLVRDTISPEPVKMRLAGNAVLLQGDRTVQPSELRPGTLVTLEFAPGNGDAPMVRQISILAVPGEAFVFMGRIENIDRSRGLLVLVDPRDNKSYEVYFDPKSHRLTRDLTQGADVTVQASFDGGHYQSRDITVNAGSGH